MNRIESVDSIRLLAITSVIAIHTGPFASNAFDSETNNNLSIIINQLARFAVPFFFVVSGYFWGMKIRSGKDPLSVTKDMMVRIATIFLAWSFIYLLPYNLSSIFNYGLLGPFKVAYWHGVDLLQAPVEFMFQGTKVHLWFLVSLLCALYLSLIFISRKAEKSFLVFGGVLYIIGVLSKSYIDTPIGISIDFDTRNGPFFSTFLFSTGYFLSQFNANKKWFYMGLLTLIGGYLLHFIEIYFLMKLYGTSTNHDYVFGTYFMGVGAALVSLSNHKILRIRSLSKVGQMTLGIYAIHFVFVDLLQPVGAILNSALWEVGYVLTVLLLSILATRVLSKSRVFRRIVS